MAYVHAVLSASPEWLVYCSYLLAGALPQGLLLLQRRGFGRRGFGRRGMRGPFRVFRVLLFASFFGPLLILAVIAFLAYAFLSGRRGR